MAYCRFENTLSEPEMLAMERLLECCKRIVDEVAPP